ncbi:MAG: hypothetical protein PVH59_01050 [Anaerolineae bacterium]|jgi:hypothetical protein
MEEPVPYQAYLVRLWPTQRGGMDDCRATIQSVATGECRHFSDLEALMAFWREQGSSPESQEQDRRSGE